MALGSDDRFAIQDLLHLYAHLADTKQLARIANEVFTPDAICDYGEVLKGRDQIHRFFTGFSGVLATSHNISNILIEGEGDRARAQCHVLAWHAFDRPADPAVPDGPRQELTMIGGYEDELVRTAGGWHICYRRALEYRPNPRKIAADGTTQVDPGGAVRYPTWP
jgi:SnoaL-like domain